VPSTFFLKPILIGLVIIPISLALWIFGNIRSNYLSADGNKKLSVVHSNIIMIVILNNFTIDVSDTSPLRWFSATLVPAIISYRGLKKQSLSVSGAVLGKTDAEITSLFWKNLKNFIHSIS
jgi:hypothetical protein